MNREEWELSLKDILPEVIEIRHHLHMHPEVGEHEKETSAFIESKLLSLGVEVEHVEGCYGLVGTLRNGEGGCIAIRADMDALPIQEPQTLPFASCNAGVMHACGHDVHMTLALGSAMWLSQHREAWQGTVRFLFEPSEETFGGGQLMVAQGCMKGVDCVIGQHVNPRYTAGTFFAKPGFVSGSSDEIILTVRGKKCHGAYPESGVDSIVIAGQAVSALQTLVSRTISPFEAAVITIGTIHGGSANNIVCGEVRMHGTMRTLSDKTRTLLKDEIVRTVEGIASAMGGEAEVEINPGYGAVYNHDGYYAIIENAAKELLPPEKFVLRDMPSLGVESFCFFLKETPGVYYDIGSGIGTALHTDTFVVDEAVLPVGIALQCESVMRILEEKQHG